MYFTYYQSKTIIELEMRKMKKIWTNEQQENDLIIISREHDWIQEMDLIPESWGKKAIAKEEEKNALKIDKFTKLKDKIKNADIDLELYNKIMIFIMHYASDYWNFNSEYVRDEEFDKKYTKLSRIKPTFKYGYDDEVITKPKKHQHNSREVYGGNVYFMRLSDLYLYAPYKLFKKDMFKEGSILPSYKACSFIVDLIEKYDLTTLQTLTLIHNSDLLHELFTQSKLDECYSNLDNDFTINKNLMDKYINNLKRLITEEVRSFTAHSYLQLIDNFIFFVDVDKILEKYSNINPITITKLAIKSNITNVKELENWLGFLNKFDKDIQDLIVTATEDLEANTRIFPNIDKEKVDKDSEYTYIQRKSLIKNPHFFEIYRTFFNELLKIDHLESLTNNPNFKSLLEYIILFKTSILKRIPKYYDTREILSYYKNFVDPGMDYYMNGELRHTGSSEEYKCVGTYARGKEEKGERLINKEQELLLSTLNQYIKMGDNRFNKESIPIEILEMTADYLEDDNCKTDDGFVKTLKRRI